MTESLKSDVLSSLAGVPDPRVLRTRRHNLVDILFIALCATISGAESFRSFADYGEAKEVWLRTLLELPSGIPSHQTFARVFARLDPQAFSQTFLRWVNELREMLQQKQLSTEQAHQVLAAPDLQSSSATADQEDHVLASPRQGAPETIEAQPQKGVSIDGKTLRRSFDRATGSKSIHMVSAWSWYDALVMGQVKTDDKSNEITAIPALIRVLDLKGYLVTIDAAGTQKEIARLIKSVGADYLLALKRNQPELYLDVQVHLDNWIERNFRDEQDQIVPHSFHQTFDADHGRVETRRYWAMPAPKWLHNKEQWAGLDTIAVVESTRTVNGSTTIHRRYYISSSSCSAQRLAHAIRNHWGIENKLHWVLDMNFREDESRVRTGNAPQNLATLRHFAINLLRNEKREARSVKRKILLAGWRNDYIEQIITYQHLYHEMPRQPNKRRKN